MFLVEKHSVATVIQSVNQTGVYTTGQQQYRQPAPGSGQPAPSYGQPSYPPPPSEVQKQWSYIPLDETSICLNVDIPTWYNPSQTFLL